MKQIKRDTWETSYYIMPQLPTEKLGVITKSKNLTTYCLRKRLGGGETLKKLPGKVLEILSWRKTYFNLFCQKTSQFSFKAFTMFALVSHYKWTLYLLNGNKGQILLLAKGMNSDCNCSCPLRRVTILKNVLINVSEP